MRSIDKLTLGLGAILLSLGLGCSGGEAEEPAPAAETPAEATEATEEPAEVAIPFEVLTAMAFVDDSTLLVADSGTGKVHALAVPEATNTQAQAGYDVADVDGSVAELLGTTRENIRIRDMAIHPSTKEAYVAVSRVTGDEYASAVVILNQAGNVRLLETDDDAPALQIPFSPAEEFTFYNEFPSRDLSFTDLEVHDGSLYIAGLSNADFASTLWKTSLPLTGEVTTTRVEIYHTVHNQQETRAPIRTMTVVNVEGTDYMVAAYTCTPLVVFPLSEIADGARITGKTIAELGFGNTPGDILAFTGQDAQQNPFPVLFIQHKNQSSQVIAMNAVAQAIQRDGLSEPVSMGDMSQSLGASAMPLINVLQIDDQDPGHLAMLRRDMDTGRAELVSVMKNVYFRLSDFQSEYEIPTYAYNEAQGPIREFQNLMKRDEGYPELARE